MTRCAATRLTISARPALRDHLHGAWWPDSTDIVRELAPMLSVALLSVPKILGVSLNRDEWPSAPLQFQALTTRSPTISWYGLTESHLAVLQCGLHRRLALLVIPPATSETVAAAAMLMATRPGNSLTARATLNQALERFGERPS